MKPVYKGDESWSYTLTKSKSRKKQKRRINKLRRKIEKNNFEERMCESW